MRLIDADALYERTAEWEAQALHMVEVTMNDEDKTKWRKWSAVLAERSAFKHDIADAPTIEPERPTGHWERVSADRYIRSANHACKCSRCGTVVIPDDGWCFCPACGARMEETK